MGSMRPSPFANSVEPLDEEAPLLDEAAEHNTCVPARRLRTLSELADEF